jgi:hypothetical protein
MPNLSYFYHLASDPPSSYLVFDPSYKLSSNILKQIDRTVQVLQSLHLFLFVCFQTFSVINCDFFSFETKQRNIVRELKATQEEKSLETFLSLEVCIFFTTYEFDLFI